jgi:hypothetical protein
MITSPYNGPENRADAANALAVDPSGNVYVTGMSEGVYGGTGARVANKDFATVKYNSNGVEQWTARYSGPAYAYDEPKAIAVDATGNVFVAGWSLGEYGAGYWSLYTTVKYVQSPVGVAESDGREPQRFELLQNYPNPFNPSTKIRYAITRPGRVTLQVFNLQGQEVATLVNENKAAGEHEIQWHPAGLPSGIYLYRVQAGEFVDTKKLVLMK